LDERAERKNLDIRIVSSGAKMTPDLAVDVAKELCQFKPDFAVATSPNASLKGPKRLRDILRESGIPTLVVTDSPAKKALKEEEGDDLGYIILEADAMIGARREFLDPTEMALFNADIMKVLAVTGVFNVICSQLDELILRVEKGEKLQMPRVVIDKHKAISDSGLQNPYAKAKAMAAHEMARRAGDIAVEGCFVVKDWESYTGLVAAAHEMMREAARLADEAREIDKGNDQVQRTPHYDDGTLLKKTRLIEKPK
jgi:methylenetetrahydromethanopterin dehydrogenase